MLPFMNAASSVASSRGAYYSILGLSQFNNISYMFRDAVRNETVIPKERYIDYGVRGYLGTFIMAYTYELAFRMIESSFTARNMAKILGFDRLSQWYNDDTKLNVNTINKLKSVTENIATTSMVKSSSFSDFANKAFRLFITAGGKAPEKLTDADKQQMKQHLPKVLEFLRKMNFYSYRGKTDFIHHVLGADSDKFLQENLSGYASMQPNAIENLELKKQAVGLLRDLLGESEASTKLINEVTSQAPKTMFSFKLFKKSLDTSSMTLEQLRDLADKELKGTTFTVKQRLDILKGIPLDAADEKSWHTLDDKLVQKLLKPVLGDFNITVPFVAKELDAIDSRTNRMIHRAIMNAKAVLGQFDSEDALQKNMKAYSAGYRKRIRVMKELVKNPELTASSHPDIDEQFFQKTKQVAQKILSEKKKVNSAYTMEHVLQKFMNEEMTWAEGKVKDIVAPWGVNNPDKPSLSVKQASQIHQQLSNMTFDGKKLGKAQFNMMYKWLNHYVGEGFKSWRVQREMKKVTSSETWPKMVVSLGMNILAHGVFLSLAEIKWAQKLEKELMAEGIAPDKVFRGPMYAGVVPALGIYIPLMWESLTKRIPVVKNISKMSRLGRHALAGALGLTAYGVTTVTGTYRNIKKERLKVGQEHHYHPAVAPQYKETRLNPITFNQFALSHLDGKASIASRYDDNPFVQQARPQASQYSFSAN